MDPVNIVPERVLFRNDDDDTNAPPLDLYGPLNPSMSHNNNSNNTGRLLLGFVFPAAFSTCS